MNRTICLLNKSETPNKIKAIHSHLVIGSYFCQLTQNKLNFNPFFIKI